MTQGEFTQVTSRAGGCANLSLKLHLTTHCPLIAASVSMATRSKLPSEDGSVSSNGSAKLNTGRSSSAHRNTGQKAAKEDTHARTGERHIHTYKYIEGHSEKNNSGLYSSQLLTSSNLIYILHAYNTPRITIICIILIHYYIHNISNFI